MRYRGREFTEQDLQTIHNIIAQQPHRAAISRQVCQVLSWHKHDGGLKEMACRVALLQMQEDGLLRLPPPRRGNRNGKPYQRRTVLAEPECPIRAAAGALADLRVEPVCTPSESSLWNEYVDRYHYLHYQPLPGAQLRYIARTQGRALAVLGFGAAAWKTAPRDQFIGWSADQREQRLHLIVNNARFLLLPWVQSKNLASKLLAMTAQRLPTDWHNRYGYRPVLLETFVDKQRFQGTCYRAANWLNLGDTKGRGKWDTDNQYSLSVKSIWVFPLSSRFREALLTADAPQPTVPHAS